MNVIVRGLLRTPLINRLIGRRLVTVYVVGRTSGRRYAVPVAYTRSDAALLVGSQFAWIRNLSTGNPVDLRLRGKRRPSEVQVVTDEAGVADLLGSMAEDNHQFAKFNRIRLDQRGRPLADDLHLAWKAGTRVAILSPR